jgi:predicted RNA-binding protein Jag
MENWEQFAKKILELMEFREYRVEIDDEHRHGAIFIYDHPALIKEHLPVLVESMNHLTQLVAKKNSLTPIFFDFNNYRQERQNLIVELARAAAKKALATKMEVSLPAMNSYERRLVHVELAIHPEVVTESMGDGRERYVIIRPSRENDVAKS